MSFSVRGVVEGFYGRPWSHEERIEMIGFLGRHGMNAYMYAPKDDPLHRDRWREPYPPDEIARFRDLARAGLAAGVTVGFAISPGLDIAYESLDDRERLLAKCETLLDAGITWFLLALDDIPMSDGLAPRQGALAEWLLRELRRRDDRSRMMLCPTEYLGVTASQYTRDLAAALPTDIALMWTGPTVCSATITTADANAWRAALPDHDLVLWDNYPVNDGTMATRLHLGPYRGRDADLDEALHGVLLNPMNQARASQIPLATAAEYLLDPVGYDADGAFERACGSDQTAIFAAACYDGPPNPPATIPLARAVAAIVGADSDETRTTARDRLHEHLLLTKTAAKKLTASNTPFALEVAPWAERVAAESRAGLAALNVIDLALADPVDVTTLMGAMFALSFHWLEARRSESVVFGPRFALYPAVVMHRSGQPAFRASEGILEDHNAIDALCRYASACADRANDR